ncbi:hypothetical protein LguiA_031303 [Lonicera macranthoides]
MAFSLNKTFLLASFLFIGLALASPVKQKAAANNDLVSQICSKTINPSVCLATLRSDPRSAKADLRELGHISINLARNSAKSTITLIGTLSEKAKDPILKERLTSCSGNYLDAVSDLDDAEESLSSGDFPGMNIRASAASDGPDDCDDEFNTRPAEPPQLKTRGEILKYICSAVLVISNMLRV